MHLDELLDSQVALPSIPRIVAMVLTELNREYIALPENQRPANEGERIQRWIVRSSQRANRDLVPFYTAWGFPITQATRGATAALPAWAENPMR